MALSKYANAAHIDKMTNCGLLDISSSSRLKVGLKAISIDPIINVGLVIAAFILVLFNIYGSRERRFFLYQFSVGARGCWFGKRDCSTDCLSLTVSRRRELFRSTTTGCAFILAGSSSFDFSRAKKSNGIGLVGLVE
jgi:hypothetical protein